jgi:proteasome assembly chaperone (PAC2) family protein
MRTPIFIQGLPGLGFVGKLAVDFLIDQLKPVKFAELYSSYLTLPDGDVGIKIELDSTFTLPKYEFYAYTDKPNVIFLTGDSQPRPWGQYNITVNVLDLIESFNCQMVVALGGYASRRRNSNAVFITANDVNLVRDLRKRFDVQPAQSGMIKGAFGVLLGLGRRRNLKSLGLLGATTGTHPDLRASRNIIQLIADLFALPINLNSIDEQMANMDHKLERLRDIRMAISPGEDQKTDVPAGYIS